MQTLSYICIIILCIWCVVSTIIDIIDLFHVKTSHTIDEVLCTSCTKKQTTTLSEDGKPITKWTGSADFEYDGHTMTSHNENDFMNCEPGKYYTAQFEIAHYIRNHDTGYQFGRILKNNKKEGKYI